MAESPVVLVTGCSTGIGRESALRLRQAGCTVVATARRPGALADLKAQGFDPLKLNVTVDADRRRAVRDTLKRHGRIDALVNNAGWGAILAAEDTSEEALREVFETNLVGMHAMTRLVLPHMRERGSGRIVNVGSIAGLVGIPMLGAYCATKFAVRGLSQALRAEVRPFGIRVSLVEPGVIETNFGTHSLEGTRRHVDPEASAYAPLYAKWQRRRETRKGKHPRVIARRIVHACTARRPRFHYYAPGHAQWANLGKRLLPDAAINAGFDRYFRR